MGILILPRDVRQGLIEETKKIEVDPVILNFEKQPVNPEKYIQSTILPRKYEHCFNLDYSKNILYLILTCKHYEQTRLKALNATWGKYVQNKIFLSDYTDIPNNTIGYPQFVPSNYNNIPYRIYEFFRDMKTFGLLNFKYYVMVDDDTFVYPKKMERFCLNQYHKDPVILANMTVARNRKKTLAALFGPHTQMPFHFPLGGAGIIFNNQCMNIFHNYCWNNLVTEIPINVNGDRTIGLWARFCGIRQINHEVLRQRRGDYRKIRNIKKSDIITFHYLNEDEFYFLGRFQ